MSRYYSLRYKLAALIAAGGLLTAIVAAAGFSWLDFKRAREYSRAQVTAVAGVVGDQISPAISLGDRKSAAEILTTLRASALIRDAALYDERSECFATVRSAGDTCPALPEDGLHESGHILSMAHPILADGERLGTLVLTVDTPAVSTVLRQYAGGALLIVVLSLVIAVMTALLLQSRVSRPILEVAGVAKRITETHSFDDRVASVSRDELGILAASFNSMLAEIQRRDATLERQRRSLLTEIHERNAINAELRQAKERAEEATRLKSEFLANMSHEIRTPMNGVLGMIGLVLERSTDLENREQLETAQTAGRALIAILNDILDLSKLEAGKMTIEAVDFELRSLVGESLRTVELAARQKGIGLASEFAAAAPTWVRGDPIRLRQVLLNLTGNAVKFTPEGLVRIMVSGSSGGLVRFEVADTGIGIESSQLNKIFDAFTQADGSHSRQFGGTGLGLTITRRLVQLMGGRLWAESEVGAGSRFYVELPLAAAAAPPTAGATPQPAALCLPPGLRVLVAEDNPVNQKVVSTILKRRNCQVRLASNGEEAFHCFIAGTFDVILMDVQMPEVDGLEATRRIRFEEGMSGRPRTPILALTAHASRHHHDQCLASGMDGVITKPVNAAELLQRIMEAMGNPPRPAPAATEPARESPLLLS